jgi:hypothetical protein
MPARLYNARHDPENAPVVMVFGGGPGTSGMLSPLLGQGCVWIRIMIPFFDLYLTDRATSVPMKMVQPSWNLPQYVMRIAYDEIVANSHAVLMDRRC